MKLAVETVYYVSHLAWLVKRGPATSCKWKDLENICAMKSLVLISRNWRSKGLRGIRSLRNSMSIENVWTHSENCS